MAPCTWRATRAARSAASEARALAIEACSDALRQAAGQGVGGPVGGRTGELQLHPGVGQQVLDRLEAADGLAELAALLGVVGGHGDHAVGQAEPAGRPRPRPPRSASVRHGGGGVIARGEDAVRPRHPGHRAEVAGAVDRRGGGDLDVARLEGVDLPARPRHLAGQQEEAGPSGPHHPGGDHPGAGRRAGGGHRAGDPDPDPADRRHQLAGGHQRKGTVDHGRGPTPPGRPGGPPRPAAAPPGRPSRPTARAGRPSRRPRARRPSRPRPGPPRRGPRRSAAPVPPSPTARPSARPTGRCRSPPPGPAGRPPCTRARAPPARRRAARAAAR